MDSITAVQFADWMPIRIYWQGNQPTVDWCHLGKLRFTDPFFTGTIEEALRQPFNLLFRRQSSIESLCELETCEPGLPPTGFIFHMSRCGSTLAAQMLAALPQNIVISEAGPVDAILNAGFHNPSITDGQRILWLRALLSAFGRRRHHQEQHFFIKFDSWHTLDLALIQQAFPTVPWIFLYRNPVEVMVSHQNMPGSQMIPGALGARIGYSVGDVVGQMSMVEYGARVLACICNAALRHRNHYGLFVDYRQLPEAVWLLLDSHFGVVPSEVEIIQMRRVAQFDAKTPCLPFVRDEADKKRAATELMLAMNAKWLAPAYERLESLKWHGYRPALPVETRVDLDAVPG
ncbi:MAG: hypothetical protein WB799_09415 [Candidatus Sulfotelmatobacter sp.]